MVTDKVAGLKLEHPFDGAVLNHRHGSQDSRQIEITVEGQPSLGDRVTVNGRPAKISGTSFSVPISLREEETEIRAVAEGPAGRREQSVRVVWDRHSRPRWRLCVDDVIFCMRDISRSRRASIFDNHFLRQLRDYHERYGMKATLNCFYSDGEGFSLSEFPDGYRGEWEDNAHWLRVSFHAYQSLPERPYRDATPEKLAEDFDLVAGHLKRIAGRAYAPTTVVHWCMVRPSAYRVLYDRGVRVLSGYFIKPEGEWDIGYRLDDARSEYLSRHEALKHFDSGIVFSRVDCVINDTPLEKVLPMLESAHGNPDTAEFMDLLTHEYCFWDFHEHYRPDAVECHEAAIRWCSEHGYEPVFVDGGYLLGKD